MRLPSASAAPLRRRHAAALLACVHLALFVAWPAVHSTLPGHEGGGHQCALCQSLQRGEGGAPIATAALAPADTRGPVAAVLPAPPPALPRPSSPAAPRAPPAA